MTKFVKKDQINSSWYEIDAKNAVVGRLATVISKIIRGKNKTTYTPHMDNGDFVVVKNIDQAKFTGNKFQNKKRTHGPRGRRKLRTRGLKGHEGRERIVDKTADSCAAMTGGGPDIWINLYGPKKTAIYEIKDKKNEQR